MAPNAKWPCKEIAACFTALKVPHTSTINTKETQKMTRKSTPIIKILAIHVLGLGALTTFPAHATLITNNLTVNGQASATTVTNIFGPASDSAYVTDSSYADDTDGSSSYANAWGNQYGTYRASASGEGVFNSFGQFHRTVNLSNNNGYDTDYSLNFFIYNGGMSAESNGVSGTGWGSYDLSIKMNGTDTLFSSMAKIHSDGTLQISGTQLDGATQNGNYYYWNGTDVTLSLGTLADGESLSIDFDLVTTAFGNFAFSNSSNCENGYGTYGGTAQTLVASGYGGYGGCTGSAYAGLGDPGDFAENGKQNPPVSITSMRSNSVPLPGTLALLGLGFAALGFSRKTLKR